MYYKFEHLCCKYNKKKIKRICKIAFCWNMLQTSTTCVSGQQMISEQMPTLTQSSNSLHLQPYIKYIFRWRRLGIAFAEYHSSGFHFLLGATFRSKLEGYWITTLSFPCRIRRLSRFVLWCCWYYQRVKELLTLLYLPSMTMTTSKLSQNKADIFKNKAACRKNIS